MAEVLSKLPNEIIYQILLCVPPASITKVQQVSKQFNDLAQPILWRHHCRALYTYWNSHHEMQENFAGPVAKVDWKAIFLERHGIDRLVNREIDSILGTQMGRIQKTEKIVLQGYDAKDSLLRHLNVSHDADDVLARRFYSDAVLGNLHRKMAIQEWVRLASGEPVPLERAFAAFDMFVLHRRKGDFNEVSRLLDQIAEEILVNNVRFYAQSPRQKAIALSDYLRQNNLVGVYGDDHYHDLQNNFIGIALQDASHPSLPLISVVIFCCVATRLGLSAQPCGFPFHVLAIVRPPPGRTLDGDEVDLSQTCVPMYMDPFRSSEETSVQYLKTQLRSMGVAQERYPELLDASDAQEIVRRCAKNIITSVQALPRHNGDGPVSTAPSFPEMDGALYGALWSLTLLPEGEPGTASLQRARFLRFIVEKMESDYLTDVRLVEEHILPFVQDSNHRESLMNTIRVVRSGDHMPKQIKRRSPDTEKKVQFSIGQVFHHKRYHYQAVITGWDVECEAGEQWIETMNVRSLSRGQHQSFYHVLVEDKSVRYVAEENIEPITQDPDTKLMALAGQHFKRWDGITRKFVSNIKDEYPDD